MAVIKYRDARGEQVSNFYRIPRMGFIFILYNITHNRYLYICWGTNSFDNIIRCDKMCISIKEHTMSHKDAAVLVILAMTLAPFIALWWMCREEA